MLRSFDQKFYTVYAHKTSSRIPSHRRKGKWMLSWIRRIRKSISDEMREEKLQHESSTQIFLTRRTVASFFLRCSFSIHDSHSLISTLLLPRRSVATELK